MPPAAAGLGTTSAITAPMIKDTKEPWSIEAAVEFIEGNQNIKKDSKKAEKKARQKQKKVKKYEIQVFFFISQLFFYNTNLQKVEQQSSSHKN